MSDRKTPAPGSEVPRSTLARFDELEVTVEKLIAGGDGMARHEGLPVFVARAQARLCPCRDR